MSDFLQNHAIQPGPFQATWESLRTYQVPDWFATPPAIAVCLPCIKVELE